MIIDEFHYDFDFKMDKVASASKRNFNVAEKDWILNEAIQLYMKQKYGLTNNRRTGFEGNQKRIDDLKTLQIKSPTSQQPGVTPVRHLGDVYEFDISNFAYDYYFLTRVTAKAKKGSCEKTIRNVVETQHDDLSNSLEYEFYKPDFNWGRALIVEGRTDQVADGKGSFYVYTDNFSIEEIYPEYLKKPNRVFIGGYNSLDGAYTTASPQVQCDLPEHTHPEIVDLAVAECSRIIENPNFNQLKEAKLTTNE